MSCIYLYHRGTRLGRIAKDLRIPVKLQDPESKGWLKIGINRANKLITGVNWGCLRVLPLEAGDLTPLNFYALNAARKTRAFTLFNQNDIPCPEWHTNYDGLNGEIDSKRSIFARMDGLSGGEGIEIIKPEDRKMLPEKRDKIEEFDFFTARISHKREFRLHVWCGSVIIEQVKFIPPNSTNPIHNHKNGCKFSTESFERFLTQSQRVEIRELALRAAAALKLEFGAVDIIQDPHGKFYVLEINTAPGIKSDPVEEAYKRAFRGLMKR